MDPVTEGQDMGLEDPSLSLHSVVPPHGQESSRQEFEQWSHQSEHCDWRVQGHVQRISTVLATGIPWTPSLVVAPDPGGEQSQIGVCQGTHAP